MLPLLPLSWTCAVAGFGSTSSELEVLQASADGLFGPASCPQRDKIRYAGAILASSLNIQYKK